MAIQKDNLRAAEHDWFAVRSGLEASAPLTEHKAKYFSDKGYGSNASVRKPLSQMESDWLQTLTGVTGSHGTADQWREAVAGAGLTASQSIDENKLTFFNNVTTSP